MVNKNILGGLKIALSKGYSLQSAMQSFYNAGYKKEEIYGAARALQKVMYTQEQQQQQNIPEKKTTFLLEKLMPAQKPATNISSVKKVPEIVIPALTGDKQLVQPKVSMYGQISSKTMPAVKQISSQNIRQLPSTKTTSSQMPLTNNLQIKKRNPVLVLLFILLTLGIYGLYWIISTHSELKKNTKSAPSLWMLFIPIVNLIYFWKYSKAINELTGFGAEGLFALWILFSPAAIILSQMQLNKKASPKAQKVSEYSSKNVKPKKDLFTIILIIAFIILVILLGLIFFFRKDIMLFLDGFLK